MNFMKPKHRTIAFLAITVLALGCKPPAEQSTNESRTTTAEQLDQVKQDTEETAQDMEDYGYAQRAEFVSTMQGRLDEINRDLDLLAAKIEQAGDTAKAEATPTLQALRVQVAKLNTHLELAKNATESTWDEVKKGFKSGYSELKNGFNQARQRVSEKIAP